MNNTAKPASFTDIAFETGVIAERTRILNLIATDKPQHRHQHECNADLETRAQLRREGAEETLERVFSIVEDIQLEDNIGAFVYVNDLKAYLEEQK